MKDLNVLPDDLRVRLAEQKVERSLAQFEIAMGHLEEKLEKSAQQVGHVVDLVKKPQEMGHQAVQHVSENRRWYVLGAVVAFAGWATYTLLEGRKPKAPWERHLPATKT